MLYGTEVAVCSQINTKHINTVWAECHFLSFKLVGALRNQLALTIETKRPKIFFYPAPVLEGALL